MIETNNSLCFCRSGKPYTDCHSYINKDSYIAKLYQLQNEIDQEIERQELTRNLYFECDQGCCACCSQCFCVSETEFIQILDFMLQNWIKEDIIALINKSNLQWNTLNDKYKSIAKKLDESVTLFELFKFNYLKLPFPCIFLDHNNRCSIYKIRPLVCRIHGVGYIDSLMLMRPCEKNFDYCDLIDSLIDLTLFGERVNDFILMKKESKIIFRRPAPLFYYFHIIFKDIDTIHTITDTEFYKNSIELNQKEYVNRLLKT